MHTRVGTAEWADAQSVAEKYRYETGKFWLGRTPDEAQTPLGYLDDRHVCLVSGSRGGKGTSTIVNNLCLWPGSVVVVDPKGENASVTATRRGEGSQYCEGMGQEVHVLDPFGVAQVPEPYRSRFNPLDELDPNHEETIDEAGRIADALVVMNPESKDPFWDESARSLIRGLILHVVTTPEFEGRRNLVTVRDLITRGDWVAVELLQQAGEENIASSQALLWEGIRRNEAFGGIVAGIGETFFNMMKNAPKQFESVLQSANRNTEFMDSPGMRRCLETSDFRLSDLKTDPKGVSLYLTLPERYKGTHHRWLRMTIALTVTEMEKVKGQPAAGHRVLMCLDEFAALERMKVIESAVAQIAGFGVKLFFVLQSLEQLKATYKDSWETFLANAGLKLFYSLEDHFSREYVSKFLGDMELVREVRSLSEGQSINESTTRGESHNRSTSRSQSVSSSQSHTSGQSWGGSSGHSRSTGSSEGTSWRQAFGWLRKDKQHNEGRNRSDSVSDGRNWGGSSSSTSGQTRGYTSGTSASYGTSYSQTSGTSRTTTEGTSETIHRRALVSPDEIGKLFARIDDKNHLAYPGLGLAVISGVNPFVFKRVNYYEDVIFDRMFDCHPDHEMPDFRQELLITPPPNELISYVAPLQYTAEFPEYFKEKAAIRKGQPYLTLRFGESELTETSFTGWLRRLRQSYASAWVLGRLFCREPLSPEITLMSPVNGYVKQLGGGKSPLLFNRYWLHRRSAEDHERLKILVWASDPIDRNIEKMNLEAVKHYCKGYHKMASAALFAAVLKFIAIAWIGLKALPCLLVLLAIPCLEIYGLWHRVNAYPSDGGYSHEDEH